MPKGLGMRVDVVCTLRSVVVQEKLVYITSSIFWHLTHIDMGWVGELFLSSSCLSIFKHCSVTSYCSFNFCYVKVSQPL